MTNSAKKGKKGEGLAEERLAAMGFAFIEKVEWGGFLRGNAPLNYRRGFSDRIADFASHTWIFAILPV